MGRYLAGLYCATALLVNGNVHAQTTYNVIVAESASGSLGSNAALYGGLRQYVFSSSGAPAVLGAGLSAGQLSDPVGVLYTPNGFFVGNRHGNTLGLGSVQRVHVTADVNLSAGPIIATTSSPSFQGFHGFNFSPTNQDLFVTTVNGGTRRYRDSGSGYADIGGVSSGVVRDVNISPDGTKMYESADGTLRITDVLANSFGATTTFNVSGASGIHQLTRHNGSLYAAAFTSGQVYRIDFDANNLPVSSSLVATVPAAIGVAFSPDGQEMYVSGHTTNQISRFLLNSGNWVSNGTIATGQNMGYIAVVPVPEPGWLMLSAVTAIAWRRRLARTNRQVILA